MKTKRLLLVLLAVVLVLSVFAGCKKEEEPVETAKPTEAPTEETVEETEAPVETPEPVVIPEGLEIHFWHAMGGGLGETMEAVCAMFNDENEWGITVVPTYQGGYTDTHAKIVAALQAGEPPHMAQAYANNIMIYKESDMVVQLNSYIFDEMYGIEDFEDILEGYRIENSSYPDGMFYSMPCNKSTEVLYYNEDFFNEHELTVPTTWEELKTTAMAASDILGKPAFGYDSLANLFITWTQQNGGQYTNADGEVLFDSAEAREALQYFVDGVEGGYFRAAGEDRYMSGPFNDGNAVMYIGSTSGSAYVGSDTFTWKSAQVPFGKEKKVIQQGSNMFMFKSTPEEELATWEFMKYLMSPKTTVYWAMNTGYLPVRVSARESADYVAFVASGVNPTKETGTSYDGSWYIFDPVFADSYSYRVAVEAAVEEAIAGTKTVDQAITDAANNLG